MDAERPHILLVDDEPAIVSVTTKHLELFGYRVTGFTSSRQALAHFTQRPSEFDLLITDQVMPDLTGLELARAVLQVRPGLPVLVVSGYLENRIVVELRESGMHAFLAKPHSSDELKTAIEALIGRH